MQIAGEYTFDAPQELVWKALRDPDVLASIMPGGEGFAEVGDNQYAGNLNVKVGPVQGKFQGHILLSDIVEPDSYTITVDGKGPQGFVKASGRLRLTPQGEQTHMAYEGNAQVGGRVASVGQRLLDSSARSIIRQSLEGLNQYLKFQVASGAAAASVDTTSVAPTGVVSRGVTTTPDEAAGATSSEGGSGEALPHIATPDVAMAEAEELAPAAVEAPMPAPQASKPAAIPEYKPPSQTQVAVNVAKDVASDLIPSQYRPLVIGVGVLLILAIIVLIYLTLT
jgi:carbon monoxide dehydrogenase subunit G